MNHDIKRMEDEPRALSDSIRRLRLGTPSLQRTGDAQIGDRRFEKVKEDIARGSVIFFLQL